MVFVSRGNADYRASTGYGLAFNEMWTRRFSTQFAFSSENVEVCLGGAFLQTPCKRMDVTTHPFEASARYQFVNDTRWKPWIGGGLRYVRSPVEEYDDHVDGQIVGGVEFLVTPAFGVTLDAKQRVTTSDPYDPLSTIALGLNWRF